MSHLQLFLCIVRKLYNSDVAIVVTTSIDALMKSLTVPLTKLTKSYRRAYKTMHPFEKRVVELTVLARVKAGKPSIEVRFNMFAHYISDRCKKSVGSH